jgi:hypothetical protein
MFTVKKWCVIGVVFLFNGAVVFSQLKVKVIEFSNYDERYGYMPVQFTETAIKEYEYDHYKNGQILESYVYKDSVNIDSVYRYHEDGTIALKGKIMYPLPIVVKDWQTGIEYNELSCSSYCQTYYKNGLIRSRQLYGKSKESVYTFNQFYDLDGELVYENMQLVRNYIKGTFDITHYTEDNLKDSISIFDVYNDGKKIETWRVKYTKDSSVVEVLDIYLHDSKRCINRPVALRRKIKKNPLVRINEFVHVLNGKGRNFEQVNNSKTEFEVYLNKN